MAELGVFGVDVDSPELPALLTAGGGELSRKLGIEITAADQARLVGTMPVAGNRQPAGLLHGGASAALAETLGSIHAALLAPAGLAPVGIELSCSHHRSALDGMVTGVSSVIQAGRTPATKRAPK